MTPNHDDGDDSKGLVKDVTIHPKPYPIIIIEKLSAQLIVDINCHITQNLILTQNIKSRQKYLSHVLEIPFLNCCHSCQSCHS